MPRNNYTDAGKDALCYVDLGGPVDMTATNANNIFFILFLLLSFMADGRMINKGSVKYTLSGSKR